MRFAPVAGLERGRGARSRSLVNTFWLVCRRDMLSGLGLLEFALVDMLIPVTLLLVTDLVLVAAELYL